MSGGKAFSSATRIILIGLATVALALLLVVGQKRMAPSGFSAEDLEQFGVLEKTARSVEHPDTPMRTGQIVVICKPTFKYLATEEPGTLTLHSVQQRLSRDLAAENLDSVEVLVFTEETEAGERGEGKTKFWMVDRTGKALGKGLVPNSGLQVTLESIPLVEENKEG